MKTRLATLIVLLVGSVLMALTSLVLNDDETYHSPISPLVDVTTIPCLPENYPCGPSPISIPFPAESQVYLPQVYKNQ